MTILQPILLASLAVSQTAASGVTQATIFAQRNDSTSFKNNTLAPIFGSNGTITIKGTSAAPGVIVLDYGANVEGQPTFQVVSTTGDTSVFEITYSETKAVLDEFYMSDGPLTLAAAMDTYRVNQYNISGPTIHTNRLIQGGFRYQKLNLSTAGELVLQYVGVKPTIPAPSLDQLPGHFETSDESLNRIWNVGARTVQLNDIPANSIPPFLQVSSEGALAESQAPQVLSGSIAATLTQYELEFQAKPITKGFAFSVLADTLNSGIYVSCNVVNGSISAHFGSTDDSAPLAMAVLPPNVTLGAWHTVHATVNSTQITVAINSISVLSFSQTSAFAGSFGVGAPFGHSAIFRNLSATSLSGENIYAASLTDETFFPDFLIGTNPKDYSVDGSKRDRIAYAGDLDIALISSLASTNGASYIKGTLDLLGSYQVTPGFFLPSAKIQQEPLSRPIDANITGLIGYSFNILTGAANFYKRTGDIDVRKEWAARAVRMLDWAHSQVLPESGLLNISNPILSGDWNYYDPTQVGIVSKFNTVYAYTLQECLGLLADGGIDTAPYISRLNALRKAIDKNLWSSSLNAYYFSQSVQDGFAQDSNALAILAGVTTSNHTSSVVLNTLKQLNSPKGPFAFSSGVVASGFAAYISPYASAYHLRAALESKDEDTATQLLHSLWEPMANPNGANYTGCFWETLDATGAPALGRATSLCHGWAAGPTGLLSEHVLGIQAVTPGYKQWRVAPLTLGLEWASGRIPTPHGDISVSWNATKGVITRLELKSPVGTSGTVEVPVPATGGWIGGTFLVNGKPAHCNGTFAVSGGEAFILDFKS